MSEKNLDLLIYYIVVRATQVTSTVHYCSFKQHEDRGDAEAEAERLAKKENDKFYVMKVERIGQVIPLPQQVEWTKYKKLKVTSTVRY